MASAGTKLIMTYRSYHINLYNQIVKRKDWLVMLAIISFKLLKYDHIIMYLDIIATTSY